MAVNTETSINDLIQKFIDSSLELYSYVSAENLIGNPNFKPKQSVKMGKRIHKIAKEILSSCEGQTKFLEVLNNTNLIVSYCAAEYLYPLSPKKCISIMKKLYNQTSNKIDKYTINSKIEGIVEKQKFFMDSYKELYNCEDLDSLNREDN